MNEHVFSSSFYSSEERQTTSRSSVGNKNEKISKNFNIIRSRERGKGVLNGCEVVNSGEKTSLRR